jgi:hypothetical protein
VQLWQALSQHLLQELSLGRAVTLAPLGVFFPIPGSQRGASSKYTFRCDEKLIRERGLMWDGDDGPWGPSTKAKPNRIAEMLGWSKKTVEEVLHIVLREIASTVGYIPEVGIEFPGIGWLKIVHQTAAFEPQVVEQPGSKLRALRGYPVTSASGLPGGPRRSVLPPVDAKATDKEGDRPVQPPASPSRIARPSPPSVLGKSASVPAIKPPSAGPAPRDPLQESLRKPTALVPFPATLMAGSRRSPLLGGQKTPLLTRTLPVNDQLFPPLLDRCSRTQAALFREEMENDRVSNTIATNYSDTSATLVIDAAIKDDVGCLVRWKKSRVGRKDKSSANDGRAVDIRAIDWASEWPSITEGSPVQQELDQAGLGQQEFCRALSRYKHYVESGVSADVLAPFNRQWLDHAVFLLDLENPARWSDMELRKRDDVIETVRQDILKGYIKAAKTAIVDYALLNSRCRERLGVPFVPVPPPRGVAQRHRRVAGGVRCGECAEFDDCPPTQKVLATGMRRSAVVALPA